MSRTIICLLCFGLGQGAAGELVPFESERWQIDGEEHRLQQYLGQPALFLRNGSALLEGEDFRDGTIEFDIAFAAERGFSGAIFHHKSSGNYEDFYLRPHQSGEPDANQYQPVFHGNTGWQIFYGPSYATPVRYRFDAWQHVRILVAGDRAEIYVDSEEPILCVRLLRADPGGSLGVHSGFAPAHFANFRFDATRPRLSCTPVEPEAAAAGTVTTWQVSNTFPESLLDGVLELDALEAGTLQWSSLDVGDRGIANLGQLHSREQGNTMLTRFTIDADRARKLPIELAFSDRAKVFVNGDLVYGGNRSYRLMDHRFLGTVGLHDSIVAELSEGRNVITVAVSEDFGGWAVGARIAPEAGITVR